jgi:hypothetical protein
VVAGAAAGALTVPEPPQDFSSFDNGWLEIAYHPSLAARVRKLENEAPRFKAELSELLGKPVLSKVRVRIGRTAGEMETLAPRGARVPKYAAGVAFSELGLVLLTASPRYPGASHDLTEVFRHELAHVALHDSVGRRRVPRWFNEGFAIFVSKEEQNARLQSLWTATLSGHLIPFAELTRSFPEDDLTASVAYAQAADLVRFLLRTGEEHRFGSLVRRLGRGQDFEAALGDAYSTDMFTLEKDWKRDVSRRYTFWPVIFGSSFVWALAFGLMALAFVRRKKRAALKLERWAREEALEDARRQLARAVIVAHPLGVQKLELVGAQDPPQQQTLVKLQTPVPTVEHEGQRYTLH